MQDNMRQPSSSLRNKIIISFFMMIIIGGILINLSFQYVLTRTLMAEHLNEEIIREISSHFISISTGLTILGSVVAIIISILLSRKITDPIKRLTTGVMALAGGRLNTRVNYTSDDEIGQLTDGFNKMAEELENAIKTSGAQREFIEGIVAAVPAILIILNDRYEILSTNISPDKSHIRLKDVVNSLKRELFRCFKAFECQTREITLTTVRHSEPDIPEGGEEDMTFIADVSMIERRKDSAIALISLTDITARKKAEVELERRLDELERFRKVTVKREFIMEDLKKRIRELEGEIERLKK